jgi:predicted GH43/DUF377 family glycosyl hydrolase
VFGLPINPSPGLPVCLPAKAVLKPPHSKRWRDCRATSHLAKRLECGTFTAAFVRQAGALNFACILGLVLGIMFAFIPAAAKDNGTAPGEPARPANVADIADKRPRPNVIPAIREDRAVDTNVMQQIYEEVKTPFKYGVVLAGSSTNELLDCPSIFRNRNHWYMMYVAISNRVGYQTFLARSDDLLHWKKLGQVLSFAGTNRWDAWQADGGIALADYHWNGAHELEKFQGRYWLSYIGGAARGYETDPLSIGIAWSKSPTQAREWNRLAENPVLSPRQPGARNFETKTLYKSQIIHDENQSLGWPFVMFYNGKYKNGFEQIGMAVSRDLKTWSRYGTNSVIVNGEARKNGISGDPQIVRIGEAWVMFYFGAGWQPRAFDTFAASDDLVHWTKWTGPHLVEPSEPFDQTYAHKPWVLKWNGVVYHFYCAVGSAGRVLALATSKDLKPRNSH